MQRQSDWLLAGHEGLAFQKKWVLLKHSLAQ
jgi:hypothetical protein